MPDHADYPHTGPDVAPSSPPQAASAATWLLRSRIPCAVLDGAGIIRDASLALKAMVPELLGRPISDIFHLDRAAASGTFARYTDTAGNLVPAVLHWVSDHTFADNSSLVFVSDGAPFRHVEAARFE